MRANLHPSLSLLLLLATASVAVAPTARADEVTDGLLPPGIAAALMRDQGVPRPGEGPFPYLIVTRRALRDEFLALARERIRNGIPSAVRSLESLRADYPAALDDPERIRLFLRDAHREWATRWVLLGGDTDALPPRYASVRDVIGDRSFVSDWYFACLDGTWDADGDGRYGEPPDPGTGDPGDAPDLIPELVVGRAPVSDHHEARDFVRKTLDYERDIDPSFEHSTLIFANRLAPFLDFAAFAELLLPRIVDDPAQQVVRLYESSDNPAWWPGALPESRASVIQALGQGHNIVIGFGAGSPDLLEVGTRFGPDPQLLSTADVLGLGNAGRAGHVWLLTSLVSAFDRPTSLGEAFLRAQAGGAVTVIAPSDLTFATQAFHMTQRFVELAFDVGVATIGEALAGARSDLASAPGGAAIAMSYQLLGDPLLRIFSSSPVAAALGGPDHGRTEVLGRTTPGPGGPGTDVVTRLDAAPAGGSPSAGNPPRGPLALSAPFPSPALSMVQVECAFAGGDPGGAGRVSVLDLAGRTVRLLPLPGLASGAATVTWDLRDGEGRRVPPGIYFLRVRAGDRARTARVLVAPGS